MKNVVLSRVGKLVVFSAAPSLLTVYAEEYGKAEYWEKRYAERAGQTFEWLKSFSELDEFLHKYVRDVEWEHEKVLDFGFGSAETTWHMHQSEGIFAQNKLVYGIDISKVALAAKVEKHPPSAHPALQYHQGDGTAMQDKPWGTGEVLDFAIDKSTTDAFYCASADMARLGRDELYRVLNKERGLWFYITYGAPENREAVSLEQPRTAPDGKSWAAVHICQKGTHRIFIMMAGENYRGFRSDENLKTEYEDLVEGVANCIDVTSKLQIVSAAELDGMDDEL